METTEKLAYSLKETAETLSVGETTLRRWIAQGRLGVVRLGRNTRRLGKCIIPAAEIRAFLEREAVRQAASLPPVPAVAPRPDDQELVAKYLKPKTRRKPDA